MLRKLGIVLGVAALFCFVAMPTLPALTPFIKKVSATEPIRHLVLNPTLTKRDQMSILKSFLAQLKRDEAKIRGAKNIHAMKTFTVQDIKVLEQRHIRTLFPDIRHFEAAGKPFFVTYAAINLDVEKENKYRFDGINYRLVVFVKERNWTIKDYGYSLIPVDKVVEAGAGFNTEHERKMADVWRLRMQGKYVNVAGETIDRDNLASPEDVAREFTDISRTSAPSHVSSEINPYYKRPKELRILLLDQKNQREKGCLTGPCVVSVDFFDYIKGVLPYEWADSAPDESLIAGALAIKMYSWFATAVEPLPRASLAIAQGVKPAHFKEIVDVTDIHTLSQTFHYKYPSTNPAQIAAYKRKEAIFHRPEVAGVGLKEQRTDDLFLAEYRERAAANSGRLSQLGADEMARAGKNHIEILKRYYEKPGKKIDFFRYAR